MKTSNIKLNLSRETLVDRIVEILENRILTGKLEPGTRLSETLVANEFEVSRSPAREAFHRLEDMNLVRRTHFGREVVRFSYEEFRDIYELKNVVEAFGAMQGSLHATARDIKKISSIIDRMNDITKSRDSKSLRRLNSQFHNYLVHCCRNNKVIETYAALVKQVRWAAARSLSLPDRPTQSTMEHQAIFEAFKQRDANKVRSLMENHTNGAMERILTQLKLKERKED
jgi:DNA-binding GntR family transcriptional regulator